MDSIVARLLIWLSYRLPRPRIIFDREGGTAYLARWYLVGRRPPTDGHGNPLPDRASWLGPQVYLHRFFRSDHDSELHSHPWKWAIAIVLAGGYIEERRVGDRVVKRRRGPFSVNLLRADDYHRVDLIGDDSWSLFIAGPKAGTWYFWCRERLARAPWRQFLAWKQDGKEGVLWESDSRDLAVRAAREKADRDLFEAGKVIEHLLRQGDAALRELDDARAVVRAASRYCEAPGEDDAEELGAMAEAVGAYQATWGAK